MATPGQSETTAVKPQPELIVGFSENWPRSPEPPGTFGHRNVNTICPFAASRLQPSESLLPPYTQPHTFFSFFFFFLFGCSSGIWMFPGQGLNPSCSLGLCHRYDHPGSLTHCTTAGTPPVLLIVGSILTFFLNYETFQTYGNIEMIP